MTKTKTKKINANKECGKCPFCSSMEYERGSLNLDGDHIFISCVCKCGKTFNETFELTYQEWEE